MSNERPLPGPELPEAVPAREAEVRAELPSASVRYAPVRGGGNGMATAALIVGALAVVAFPAGPVLGAVALVLGVIGLIRARHLPAERRGRAAAIVGMGLGVVGGLAGAHFFLRDVLAKALVDRKAVCAANLRGIGQGIMVYSNDNYDSYPVVLFHPAPDDGSNATEASFVGQLGANRNSCLMPAPPGNQFGKMPSSSYLDPNTPDVVGVQNAIHARRSLFMLVLDGTCVTLQFICPESGDTMDDLRQGPPGPEVASQPGLNRFDFLGYSHVSYGYQLPFGRFGRPSEKLDAKMPLMADKGPFYQAGARRGDGSIPDQPVAVPGSKLAIAGVKTAADVQQLSQWKWRAYNSRNHKQQGQNVLRVDGSVRFETSPIVGIGQDNIYTMQGPGLTALDVVLGWVPADRQGPRTNTDSVIVP